MRWMILAVLVLATVARAESPADELIRLRKENAALKAENAKLKEELAAAKPAAPKATAYTPAMIAKLVPVEFGPPGLNQKWDQAKRDKAKKIMEARLAGEWISVDAPITPFGDDAKQWVRTTQIPAGNMLVRFEGKLADPSKGAGKGATGKVRSIALLQSDVSAPPLIVVVLDDCQVK